MRPKPRANGLVYSTELGRTCPDCRAALNVCVCSSNTTRILGDGRIRVGRSSKGRGGKTVTIVTGLPLNAPDLAAAAAKLKKRCGTGGTVKDGAIEIQGDHRDVIIELLQTMGYSAKPTGG